MTAIQADAEARNLIRRSRTRLQHFGTDSRLENARIWFAFGESGSAHWRWRCPAPAAAVGPLCSTGGPRAKLANLVQTPNQVRYPAAKAKLDHTNLIREFRGSKTRLTPRSF
jgi:hypothetical protein